MKKGIIISGGTPCNPEFLLKHIDDCITVVCADSGYLFAKKLGIVPDAVIGDFDSMSVDEIASENKPQILKHKVEKDETDTQLCLDFLAKNDVDFVYIFCALGGERFEHTFANLKLLEYAFEKGINAVITDENTEIFLVSEGKKAIKGNAGDHISVFTLHGASGITYKGLKYPMNGGELKSSDIIGISNSMTETQAEISVQKGQLIIIHTGKCIN